MLVPWLRSFNCLILFSLLLFFLWVPSLIFARWLILKRRLPASDLLPFAFLALTSEGYAVFWIYFFDWRLGRAASLLCLSFPLVLFCRRIRWDLVSTFRLKEVRTPLICLSGIVLFYGGLLLSSHPYDGGIKASELITSKSEATWDNILPFQFAEHLFKNEDPRDAGATWRSSDRPPLQAGITLVYYPLFYLFTEGQGYEWLALTLQASWVFSFFWLASTFAISRRSWVSLVVIATFSQFFYLNTVYVWPKLLAATLFILSYLFLYHRPSTRFYILAAGVATSLSLLSHGGSAFAYLGLGMYTLFVSRKLRLKHWLWWGSSTIPGMIPWMLYQKYYDPPGDGLLKMHLAGAANDDPRSFATLLKEGYEKLTLSGWIHAKELNLRAFFPDFSGGENIFGCLRIQDYYHLFHEWGFLMLGIFFLASAGKEAKRLFLIGVFTLGFWVVLLYPPGGTVIHQGSYVIPLLGYFVFSWTLSVRFEKWIPFLVGEKVLYFILVYIFFGSFPVPAMGIPFILLSFAGLALLFKGIGSGPPVRGTVSPLDSLVLSPRQGA
jgi:hypothetical protein